MKLDVFRAFSNICLEASLRGESLDGVLLNNVKFKLNCFARQVVIEMSSKRYQQNGFKKNLKNFWKNSDLMMFYPINLRSCETQRSLLSNICFACSVEVSQSSRGPRLTRQSTLRREIPSNDNFDRIKYILSFLRQCGATVKRTTISKVLIDTEDSSKWINSCWCFLVTKTTSLLVFSFSHQLELPYNI